MMLKQETNKQVKKAVISSKLMGSRLPFPIQLHQMLEDMTQDTWNESIVSWQPHGKAFRVHKPIEFAQKIMPQYFKQTKYKSFQRQLYLYGFQRIHSGLDIGAFYHKSFIKDDVSLCFEMRRCKIKGTNGKHWNKQLLDDPNFYVDNNTDKNKETIMLEQSDDRLNQSRSQYDDESKPCEMNDQWISKSTTKLYEMVFNETAGDEFSINQQRKGSQWKNLQKLDDDCQKKESHTINIPQEKEDDVESKNSSQDDDDDCLSTCSISIQEEEVDNNNENHFFDCEESFFAGRKFFTVDTGCVVKRRIKKRHMGGES